MRQRPEAEPDGDRRNQDADRRQHRYRADALAQSLPFDMQAAGEQQKRQHAVHDGVIEVDAAQNAADFGDHTGARQNEVYREQDDRRQHAHQQQADIARHLEKAGVDPAKCRGEQQQERE